MLDPDEIEEVLLPYGFTLFSNFRHAKRCNCRFYYLMDLHYSQTALGTGLPRFGFTTLWIYTILKLVAGSEAVARCFTTLWIYTILKHKCACFHSWFCFTTLWIYTILKRSDFWLWIVKSFTTLWIYTILKPQISCAHYTAQGKSTRSSTIVLWRNGIVKGAQIPIQHIEFGAHIYAHRRLAL